MVQKVLKRMQISVVWLRFKCLRQEVTGLALGVQRWQAVTFTSNFFPV